MATSGQRYAVGIGTGAAGGAVAGTSILPGWGTAIGAGIGAIGGAVGAGMANSQEAKERALMEQAHARSKKEILLNLLRDRARAGGIDTTGLDTQMELNDLNVSNTADERQFQAQHRIDPNSFAPMAQMGTQAAGKIYDAYSHAKEKNDLQLQPFQTKPGPSSGVALRSDEF